jgi:tRNA(Ile)-lysidine synthase
MELVHIRNALQNECQVAMDKLLVVGVSGGPDSLCLLDSLHRLGITLLAAHFDHGLREDSASDARQVAALVQGMGIPYRQARRDVGALAAKESLTIEEAARKARYRFLFDTARANQAQAVAVAHTADDQVETVLMHLLRGAGLSGLKGMVSRLVIPEWDAQIPLVRPLLGVWRRETEAWCAESGLQALIDPSNQDTAFFRNRLRHELIPELQTYNPNIKDILWRTANVLAGDWETIEGVTDMACRRCQMEKNGARVALNLAELQTLATGLQRAVMRRAIAHMRAGLLDIDASSIDRCLEWLKGPARGQWLEVGTGLHVGVEWGRVILSETRGIPIAEDWPQVSPGVEVSLAVPGEAALSNHWMIRATKHSGAKNIQAEDFFQASQGVGLLELSIQLDAKKLVLPLTVRGFKPGERLAPLGMAGHSIKLSDYFTNRKLPKRARRGWPLVISGGETAWVCGLRLSEHFKVDDQTQEVICLELMRQPLAHR